MLDKTGIVIVKDPRAQLRDVSVAAGEVPLVPIMTMGKMPPRLVTAGIMRVTVPGGAVTGFC